MVANLQFPAGTAVLPHVLRILERDATGVEGVVRASAVKGLRDVEMLVHSRMPAVKSILKGKVVDEEEEEGEESEAEVNGMVTEEDGVAEEVEVSKVPLATQVTSHDNALPLVQPTIGQAQSAPSAPKSALPSFVTNTQSTSARPTISAPTNTSTNTSTTISTSTAGLPTSVAEVAGKKASLHDVFSMGAWKGVQTTEEDDDEAMPEIDLASDTDEE